YYFIYKKVKAREVALEYILIYKIVADRLTKPLKKDRFLKFYKALSLRRITNIEDAS
ncbi:hypothetical protein BBK36DRAFT_1131216, partial [Trichoderma citrinoviride]